MSNIFKNNEAIVHQGDKGETTVFPKNSIWYKIGFDTNMVTFRSRYNDEVIFYENDVTELTIDGKLPENFVTEFNQIAYGEGAPKIEYDILAVYNVTSTTYATSLSFATSLTKNVEKMYIDDVEVAIGNSAKFDEVGTYTVKYKLINNTIIGGNAFSGCKSLTSINIPNSVTFIGNNAFLNCSGLKSIDIPNSVETINGSSFSGCTNLSYVTFGNSVRSIDSNAFNGCESLKEINIPDSVTNIGDHTFNNCTSVSSITIGSGLQTIGNGAFLTLSDINSIQVSEDNQYFNSRNNSNAIISTITNRLLRGSSQTVIPDGVTKIGDSSFSNCSGLTSINIPNSVTSIGDFAFSNCTSLKEIDIPDSVTIIDIYAFANCYSLTSATLGSGVTTIGDFAFITCTSLTSITCNAITAPTIGVNTFATVGSNGVLHYPCGSDYSTWLSTEDNYLGKYNWTSECFGEKPEIEYDLLAVYNVTSTTSAISLSYETSLTNNVEKMYIDDIEVEIGNAATFAETGTHTVKYKLIDNTTIGNNAFKDCSGLTELVILDSVTSIGDSAFYGSSRLTNITIPNSVTSIGNSAFHLCLDLTQINIPNSVTSIGNSAFYYCSKLTSVIIPNSVTSIGNRTFYNCSKLTSVIIPNSVTSIGNNVFQNCNSLTEIDIPDSVTSIGEYTFAYCSKLTSVTIPNSVTSIGILAFWNCSGLTSVTIGSGVTSIGGSAFRSCSGLTSITLPQSVTSIGGDAFTDCGSLTSITCNATTAPSIQSNTFANIGSNGVLYYPCGSDYSTIISNLPSTWSNECFSNEIDYTFAATYNVRNINSPATLYSTYQPYFQDNIEKMYLNDEEIPISSTYQFPEIGEYEVKYKLKNTSLPDYAFYQIRTVYTIDLKDVTEIGLSCFENSFLKGELILGENIQRIGANAFEQTDITDVTIIPTFISCYNSRFTNCSNLSSVTSNEQFIWSSDFEGCGDLVVTNFPNLEEIGQKAFSRCVSLSSFTVPSTVKNISHKAFEDCTSLTEITFEMPTLAGVELGTDIFFDCTQHITIDYPCSANYEVLLNQIENYSTNCLSDKYDIKAVYQVLTPNEEIVLFNEGEINFIPYLEKMYVDNEEIDLTTLIKVNESYSIGNRLVFAETGEHTVKYKLVDSCNFVENAAFLNITSLVSVNLAKDFVSIGYNAFEQCVNLHTVKLPNSVEYIYNGAFYSCTSLTSVTLGEYVREIGWNAFERCQSLNFIEFKGTTAPTITSNSFADVATNGTIVHPCGYNYNAIRTALPTWYCECDMYEITDFNVLALYEIDEASAGIPTPIAFELTNLNQIYVNEVPVGVVSAYTFNSAGQYLVKYKLVDSTTIKSVSGGTTFNKTLNAMFCSATGSLTNFTVKSACTKMSGVAIMEGVRGIDQYSFAGCSGLTEVIFPSTLTSAGNNAFNGCTSLDSVNIPSIESWCRISFASANSNPTNYSKKLYIDGELQTSINIPDGVTSIRNYTFQSCSGLTSIVIPDSVTSIGNYTFRDCSSLASVTLGSGVTSIGEGVFSNCTNLPVIDNIRYADTYLVEPIDKTLTTYTIKEGTKFIGSSAFTSCSSLTEINILDSVNSIGKYAFSGCSSLASVTLGSGVTSIGDYAFRDCSSLTSINIPDSVTSIVQYTFYGCSGLTSVTIGSGVTKIGGYAFNNCTSLTSINIPDSVNSIDGNAFANCSSLTSITCYAITAPTIHSLTFYKVAEGGVLKYPCNATGYDTWMQSTNYYLGLYNWSTECL